LKKAKPARNRATDTHDLGAQIAALHKLCQRISSAVNDIAANVSAQRQAALPADGGQSATQAEGETSATSPDHDNSGETDE
jgi:hypothetical protein